MALSKIGMEQTRELICCCGNKFQLFIADHIVDGETLPFGKMEYHSCQDLRVWQDKGGLKRYYKIFNKELSDLLRGAAETKVLDNTDAEIDIEAIPF